MSAGKKYDLEKIRQRMKQLQGNRFKDPNEFRAPKCEVGHTIKYKFYILPPLDKGDKTVSGKCTKSMDDYFCIKTASHFINNQFLTCPRVLLGEKCDLCDMAFEMMSETEDKAKRSAISKNFLPGSKFLVNIWFPPMSPNPTELQDKVMFFAGSKQVADIWEATLMRDDAGTDVDNPEPFGTFFDELAAFPFLLNVTHQGGYNEYKSSKFAFAQGPRPIADDKEKIQWILDNRNDLWSKIDPPDPAKIAEIVSNMKSGGTGGGFDVVEEDDEDPKAEKPKVEKPKVEQPKAEKPKISQSVEDEMPLEENKTATAVAESSDDDDDDNDPEILELMKRINAKKK